MRAGIERVLEQYRHFEWRNLAVRGNRLALSWSRWWDDAGNETTYLHLRDIGDDRRVTYDGRFDEDDFEGAYLELERRYYAGEGVASAEAGAVATGYAIALNRSEFDRAFGDLTAVDFRLENRSRSGFGDRSAAELRATYEDLTAMVASARIWYSALCWMSSTLTVGRFEREAVGLDGEHYTWTLIQVAEIRDGRVALACQFDLEDEAAAFAYAEERVRAASSRLAVTNRASASVEAARLAMRAHDVDGVVAVYSDRFEYDDRRRLSGGPRDTPAALRAAVELLLEQYPHFEWRTLAVRGERLGLHWSRWWDEAGNEAAFLHLFEVGDDGRVTYDGRFDEEDFEGAYRELERRYCAGEGKPFAEVAALEAEWLIAFNKGDFDRVFGELTDPGFRVEIRSASPFPDHSAAELRVNFEDLNAMFSSARYWNSAVCWLDSRCGVVRHERDAVGLDGEQYAWSRLYVFEASNGRAAWLCEFRLEDEAAAFACAEERMRAADSA
jgi:ketosteroid isomerase-like protein